MIEQQSGMLLVGHGTRDDRGVAEFLQLAQMVTSRLPDVAVEAGFLELASPTISDALQRLVDRGVNDVVVVPLLLFAAGHAKQDIPNEVGNAAASFCHLKVRQAEPLGCHKQILAASAERFFASLQCTGDASVADVALVMASRGSSDSAAIAHVHHLSKLRCELTPVADCRVGFMAVAQPTIGEALQSAEESDCETIVVQPHLLFHGKVFQDLQAKLAEAQARATNKRLVLAKYLGPCEEVAIAAIERFHEANVLKGD